MRQCSSASRGRSKPDGKEPRVKMSFGAFPDPGSGSAAAPCRFSTRAEKPLFRSNDRGVMLATWSLLTADCQSLGQS